VRTDILLFCTTAVYHFLHLLSSKTFTRTIASAAGAKGRCPLDSHAPPGLLRLRAGRGMLRALHPYKKWSAALRFFTACLLKTLPEYGRI